MGCCCCGNQNREYKRWKVALLCITLGWLGIHRYYVKKDLTGVLYNFTLGLCGIGIIYDFIMICLGKFTTKCGEPIK